MGCAKTQVFPIASKPQRTLHKRTHSTGMDGVLRCEQVTIYRRATRVDANQQQIVSALEAAGASVWVIGRPTDLLVGHRGITLCLEVKNPASRYGKAGANKNQRDFMATWKGGPVALVDSAEAALRAIGAVT